MQVRKSCRYQNIAEINDTFLLLFPYPTQAAAGAWERPRSGHRWTEDGKIEIAEQPISTIIVNLIICLLVMLISVAITVSGHIILNAIVAMLSFHNHHLMLLLCPRIRSTRGK